MSLWLQATESQQGKAWRIRDLVNYQQAFKHTKSRASQHEGSSTGHEVPGFLLNDEKSHSFWEDHPSPSNI